jgi:hypothetical protein
VQQEASRVVDLLDEEVMLKTLELENFRLRAQIDLNQKQLEVSRRVMMNGGGGESRIQAGAEGASGGTGSDGHESGCTDERNTRESRAQIRVLRMKCQNTIPFISDWFHLRTMLVMLLVKRH